MRVHAALICISVIFISVTDLIFDFGTEIKKEASSATLENTTLQIYNSLQDSITFFIRRSYPDSHKGKILVGLYKARECGSNADLVWSDTLGDSQNFWVFPDSTRILLDTASKYLFSVINPHDGKVIFHGPKQSTLPRLPDLESLK